MSAYCIDFTEGIVQTVMICKPHESGNGSLVVMDTKRLTERLDPETMQTYVTYQGRRHEVHGVFPGGYIIVD